MNKIDIKVSVGCKLGRNLSVYKMQINYAPRLWQVMANIWKGINSFKIDQTE